MLKIKVIFFASLKERLDCTQIEQQLDKNSTVANLCETLASKGGEWQRVFSEAKNSVKVACNQQMAEMTTFLNSGDEVAFFPPVTGG